ncbi:hypothetical protein OC842_001720 [Tilletia horrida]|uniref:Thiamine-binding protein domain-containing protein n=1 Tax=Tilletia horrida TaxID=155126 RepID=A0AAN6GEJ1_9BASI|nr:hypothetical protein OC842_001720 [Tilletia horrida]
MAESSSSAPPSTAGLQTFPPPEELYAVADFCLIPMGTGDPSVGKYIAECQRVLESFKRDGLAYELRGYGTELEGPWHLVTRAIHECHRAVHALGAPRIATDIRIGTATYKKNTPASAPEGLTSNQYKKWSVLQRLEREKEKDNPASGSSSS